MIYELTCFLKNIEAFTTNMWSSSLMMCLCEYKLNQNHMHPDACVIINCISVWVNILIVIDRWKTVWEGKGAETDTCGRSWQQNDQKHKKLRGNKHYVIDADYIFCTSTDIKKKINPSLVPSVRSCLWWKQIERQTICSLTLSIFFLSSLSITSLIKKHKNA